LDGKDRAVKNQMAAGLAFCRIYCSKDLYDWWANSKHNFWGGGRFGDKYI